MGLRTKVELGVCAGLENSLDDLVFERDLSSLLDTLDRHVSQTVLLEAGTTDLEIDLGDITEARLIYIESDLEIEVALGGVAALGAVVDGSGGTFPTLFAGGETITGLDIDGQGPFTVTFTSGASTVDDVVNEINSAAALAGIVDGGGIPVTIARNNGGQLRIVSPTTGSGSEVVIGGGTALATLGLTAGTTTGTNSTPGTSNVLVHRPADPAGASAAAGVPAYMLLTTKTTRVALTNPSSTIDANVIVFIAGDLTDLP